MAKPSEIIDRDAEWEALAGSWTRDRPELVFVLGRRRVGKSFVLSRFSQHVGGVYYQATRRTEAEQLAGLSRTLGQHFGDAAFVGGAVLPSWEALFEYVTAKMGAEPFLLVLDEFPYLAAASASLTSVIQKMWDHQWQKSRIRLVLCGSYITAMQQLEELDQPLYGRRTARVAFEAFTCSDTSAFVPGWPVRDRLMLYGTVGNLPGHLALVDAERSLGENVTDLLLHPSGRLVDDAQHMLDAFVGEADVHYSIIEAIATGDRTWSGITGRVGKTGGALSRPLQWLERMQIIGRDVPITDRDPRRSKRAIYRITDPYVSFWHAMIAPLVRAGSIGLARPTSLYRDIVTPRLDGHMGHVFEQICREHAARLEEPFEPLRVGGWWDSKSQNEVDVVALSADDQLFVAECKWGPVTARDLESLRRRSLLVAAELPRVTRVHLGLYTARGEADETVRAAVERGEARLFGPDDVA